MPLTIRNKSRILYSLAVQAKKMVYGNPLLLKACLAVKEPLVRGRIRSLHAGQPLFKKIYIETVSYCNNECMFCPASVRSGTRRPEWVMSGDVFSKILNDLESIAYEGSVAFHCNNEPLLDIDLAGRILAARQRLGKNFFYLYTNGTLLDVERANQLFDAGLDRIIVNNYDNRHRLIPSVRKLAADASRLKGEVLVYMRRTDECLGNRAGESPNARYQLCRPLRLVCLRPQMEMAVVYDGTVVLCCADGAWKVAVGNVQQGHVRDIWFSDPLRSMRESLLRGERDCAQTCRRCDALSIPALRGVRA